MVLKTLGYALNFNTPSKCSDVNERKIVFDLSSDLVDGKHYSFVGGLGALQLIDILAMYF